MKKFKFFSILGLGLFAAASVGAGLSIRSNSKAMAPVEADEEKTWMTNFSINLKEIILYEGFDPDSVWMQTYTDGVGNSNWFHMFPIKEGSAFYSTNASFAESYSYDRIQFKYTEGSGEQWAKPYSHPTINKANHLTHVYCRYFGWDGAEWTFTMNSTSELYVTNGDSRYYFEENVSNNTFVAREVVSDGAGDTYYTLLYREDWAFAELTLSDVDADKDNPDSVFFNVTTERNNLKAGKYDVVLKNDNSGNGLLQFFKYKDPNESFIYYVTESSSATTDYIYAWGGSEQFGAFPGTPITSIEGVREITGNGVMHFQGKETPVLIYSIPITLGHPVGDTMFMFNNGTEDYKSAERLIKLEYAYWWTGDANGEAGDALDFLVIAEAWRNKSEDHSICNMSDDEAAYLVGIYNSSDENTRKTYINPTTIYTHKRDGSEGNELVPMSDIIVELGKKGGVTPVGFEKAFANADNSFPVADSTVTITIIVIASTLSVAGLIALVTLKKRKQH